MGYVTYKCSELPILFDCVQAGHKDILVGGADVGGIRVYPQGRATIFLYETKWNQPFSMLQSDSSTFSFQDFVDADGDGLVVRHAYTERYPLLMSLRLKPLQPPARVLGATRFCDICAEPDSNKTRAGSRHKLGPGPLISLEILEIQFCQRR